MLDDLTDTFYHIQQGYGMGGHMSELSAMGDYNNEQKQNLFGRHARKVTGAPPASMMPGFMEWLAENQPVTYTFLYGELPPAPRQSKHRGAEPNPGEERHSSFSRRSKPPNPPKPPPDECKEIRKECEALGKSGESCYRALAKKHHPDRGGTREKMQKLNDCRDKL
jgi:hypothetical protein